MMKSSQSCPRRRASSVAAVLVALTAACAPAVTQSPGDSGPALPPIPPRNGPLDIQVMYPSEGAILGVRDSTFIFGNVGTGQASLTINRAPVEVAPNGAFLAFLPVPPEGVYQLSAATGAGQTDQLTHTVELPPLSGPDPVPEPEPVPAPVPGAPVLGTPVLGAPVAAVDTPTVRVGIVNTDRIDGMAIGTAVPGSGTPYNWFFPNGTLLTITGKQDTDYKVQLTDDLSVWVGEAGVDLLPPGTPLPDGAVATVRAVPEPGYIDLRLSTTERLPFQIDETPNGLDIIVYGAETRTNWLQYGETDPLIHRMEWNNPADDIYRLHVELNQPLWGFMPFYDEDGTLVVRVRRPPPIDPQNPVSGLYIGVDAGHPPGGAIGPTGYMEYEANLAISKYLVEMMESRGARVLETRPDTAAVGLGIRPQMAMDSSVQLLVSVHNNAFPDGVNPFENNGTSVFYNQAQSLDLARAFQRELLAEFGLRDLGIARADLALVRPTWFPSALTETMFLMIPEQEAALRNPEVQRRIAEAHLRAIESFLRTRAAAQ